MNNKTKFLNLFLELMLKARNEHSDFFESIPVNEKRHNSDRYNHLTSIGAQIRFPFEGDESRKKSEISDKIREIGAAIVESLLTVFQDEISVDLRGHNKIKESYNLGASDLGALRRKISIFSICHRLGFMVGVNTSILPKGIDSKIEPIHLIEAIYQLFDIDNEDGLIVGPDDMQCNCCGDELRPLLDINTLKISLHPTLDYKDLHTERKVQPRACPYPNGVGLYSGKIKTPSKKLVIANDLRSILKEVDLDKDDYISAKFNGYTTISACQLANVYNTEFYSNHHNMMYVQCGSGGVSLFQDKTTNSIQAKPEYIFSSDKLEDVKNSKPNEENVGYVDFSLWAMCAMDYDEFVELCKSKDGSRTIEEWISDLEVNVVTVKESETKFTSHYFNTNSENELLVEIE